MNIVDVEVLVDDPAMGKALVTYTERQWLFFQRTVKRMAFKPRASLWRWMDDGRFTPDEVEVVANARRAAKLLEQIEQNHKEK